MREKKKLISRLFEKKNWRRVVQVLSCMVVFCTTYALILPAITQEARAYCGTEAHEHSAECYEKILSCTKEEHQHDESCRDEEGNLVCVKEEHFHNTDCFREVMNCQKQVHQHSLICYSDPYADLETPDDWVRSLPEEKDKKPTTRENVIAAALSQENVKESDRNYQVDNETEIRGITRYGQWDGSPYLDDWSGAFIRFLLHYSGVSSEKVHPKQELIEWMNELNRLELLSHISEGKEGDIVFINNSEDEIRAGLILSINKDERTFTAMMGDWGRKVSKQKYSLDSDKIHSVFKLPVTDDPVEEPKDEDTETNVNESESVDKNITDNNDLKPEENSEKKETNNDSSDEPEKNEESNESEAESSQETEAKPDDSEKFDKEDLTSIDNKTEILEAESDDGVIFKAYYSKGTLPDDVRFQVKSVQLSNQDILDIKEKVNDETLSSHFIAYDIKFYVNRDDNELKEIEPDGPVRVECLFKESSKISRKQVLHINSDGDLEIIKTEEPNGESIDDSKEINCITFESESFSTFVFPVDEEGIDLQSLDWQPVKSRYELWQAIKQGKSVVLTQDLENSNDCFDLGSYELKDINIFNIDLNGYKIQSSNIVFKVPSNKTLNLVNNREDEISEYPQQRSDLPWWSSENGTSYITFRKYKNPDGSVRKDDSPLYYEASNIGLLISTGNKVIENNGGQVNISGTGMCSSMKETAIVSNGGSVNLNKCYVTRSLRGIYQSGGNLQLSQTVVSWNEKNNANDRGGGICLENGAKCVIRNHSLISGNESWAGGGIAVGKIHENLQNDAATTLIFSNSEICGNRIPNTAQEGGGVAVTYNSGAIASFLSGEIYSNYTNTESWGGGGVFGSEGTYVIFPNGASIYNNKSWGLGGGFTGCSTGKIILQSNMWITDNEALGDYNHFHKGNEKQKDNDYKTKYQVNGSPVQNANGAKGEDIFGADLTVISGTFDNGTPANWSGNIDGKKVENLTDSQITANDWITVQSQAKNDPALKTKALKIYNNASNTHGGGVLINGFFSSDSDINQYLPDKFYLEADKRFVDSESGKQLIIQPDQFEFELLNSEKEVIGTAFVNTDGSISFEDGITVMHGGSSTYYLREKSGTAANIEYDSTEYRIDVSSDAQLWKTYRQPVYDDETGAITGYQTVNIYNVYIRNLVVKNPENNSWNSYQADLGSPKKIKFNSGAFENRKNTRTNVLVQKTWEDGNSNHSADFVEIELKKKIYSANGTLIKEETVEKFRLDNSNNWQKSFDSLPTEDENQNYIEYFVGEISSSNPLFTSGTPIHQVSEEIGTTEVNENMWLPIKDSGTWELKNHSGEQIIFVSDDGYLISAPDSGYSTAGMKIIQSNVNGQTGYREKDVPQSGIFVAGSKNGKGTAQVTVGSTDRYLGYYDNQMNLRSYNDIKHDNHHLYLDSGILMATPESPKNYQGLKYKDGKFITSSSGPYVRGYLKQHVQGTLTTKTRVETFTIENKKIPTYGFDLHKTDSMTKNNLAGAVFEIRTVTGNSESVLNFIQTGNSYVYSPTQSTATVSRLVTDQDGLIHVTGLLAGTYKVVEVEAPEGYRNPFEIGEVSQEIILGNSSQIQMIEIENTPYTYELPETGGSGTEMFQVAGSAMIIVAAVSYGFNRKKKRKEGEE